MSPSRSFFLLFMIFCIAIFSALGVWQVKRLHWKQGLIDQINQAYAHDPEPPFITAQEIISLPKDHFLRAIFRGHLDFTKAFLLQGQIDNEKQSSHTLVPYIISKDVTILVDFGSDFTVKDKNNSNTIISGLLRNVPASNRFTPDDYPKSNIWYALDRGDLNIKNLKPFEILPEHTPWKEYQVRKPELRNEHLHYAMFWFAMAAITAVLTGYYLIKKTDR